MLPLVAIVAVTISPVVPSPAHGMSGPLPGAAVRASALILPPPATAAISMPPGNTDTPPCTCSYPLVVEVPS
ncbi:hypothetical protein GGS23DRAFT_579889 [Durotheca rogersii]|uniref:uncharacterized protein n=1 Tax=Durotheca rogersii TaxID=419775 RepID=UPI00221F93B5|nr:uncharacterized protein GGS23DRAFT_579889 [Durotheca rogersii]KAI5860696.1 hypothetical protein GGS23DRAFT_579889 [Durotheca rogersii]